jgi:hypothetical protein
MNFKILKAGNIDDREIWKQGWAHLPPERRDVYYLPEYLLAYEVEGRGEACCALVERGDAVWIYPFLKCKIALAEELSGENILYDIQSPYGYGGPVVNEAGEDKTFLFAVWQVFSDWCVSAGIVGEFCRFHPLLDNNLWAPQDMQVLEDRKTVVIDLNHYPDAIWKDSFFRNHRHMVRKADREGYVFQRQDTANEMEWFAEKYAYTQDLLNADSETRFREAYFKTLTSGLRDKAWLGIVKKENRILTAVLVLEGQLHAHSHLMVYLDEGPAKGMTNSLYHGVALEAAKSGLRSLHMGGGKTSSTEDALFRFKSSLSPARCIFYIGKRCHNMDAYQRLGAKWEELHGPRPSGYFLFYRL